MNNKLQGKTELSRIHELMGSVGGSSKSKNPKNNQRIICCQR